MLLPECTGAVRAQTWIHLGLCSAPSPWLRRAVTEETGSVCRYRKSSIPSEREVDTTEKITQICCLLSLAVRPNSQLVDLRPTWLPFFCVFISLSDKQVWVIEQNHWNYLILKYIVYNYWDIQTASIWLKSGLARKQYAVKRLNPQQKELNDSIFVFYTVFIMWPLYIKCLHQHVSCPVFYLSASNMSFLFCRWTER